MDSFEEEGVFEFEAKRCAVEQATKTKQKVRKVTIFFFIISKRHFVSL